MSSSEVQIAANLTAAAQARQCAEAGLEYALSEMNVPEERPSSAAPSMSMATSCAASS
jgi:hypothetical protein